MDQIVVFDMDGVLANCEHRVHLIKEKGWDAFHSMCYADDIYLAEWAIANMWSQQGGWIIYHAGHNRYPTHADDHGDPALQLKSVGLDKAGIVAAIRSKSAE